MQIHLSIWDALSSWGLHSCAVCIYITSDLLGMQTLFHIVPYCNMLPLVDTLIGVALFIRTAVYMYSIICLHRHCLCMITVFAYLVLHLTFLFSICCTVVSCLIFTYILQSCCTWLYFETWVACHYVALAWPNMEVVYLQLPLHTCGGCNFICIAHSQFSRALMLFRFVEVCIESDKWFICIDVDFCHLWNRCFTMLFCTCIHAAVTFVPVALAWPVSFILVYFWLPSAYTLWFWTAWPTCPCSCILVMIALCILCCIHVGFVQNAIPAVAVPFLHWGSN